MMRIVIPQISSSGTSRAVRTIADNPEKYQPEPIHHNMPIRESR
jgi:hypothetical protein